MSHDVSLGARSADAEELSTPVQEQSQDRALILISGFIHDARDFISEHPGGATLIKENCGKDMTAAFFGGVYDHSNAAHNVSRVHTHSGSPSV